MKTEAASPPPCISIIPPGTKVCLPQAEILNAVVTAVTILAGGVTRYNVAWWNGVDRKEAWVEDFEVTVDIPKYVPVGFLS